MKKREVNVHQYGSANYVVKHADWSCKIGKRPSVSFQGILNPIKALAEARRVLRYGTLSVALGNGNTEGGASEVVELVQEGSSFWLKVRSVRSLLTVKGGHKANPHINTRTETHEL